MQAKNGFIKLTSILNHNKEEPCYIRSNDISAIYQTEKNVTTIILSGGGYFNVKEAPAKIMTKIERKNIDEYDVNDIKEYTLAFINQKPYMFSKLRIDPDTVPDGFFTYNINRKTPAESFTEIKPFLKNYYIGTIIGTDRLPLDKTNTYQKTSDREFLQTPTNIQSLEEFIEQYDKFKKMNPICKTNQITTRKEMQNLLDGDTFFVYGKTHTAKGDAHLSGDASYDGYIVYDTDDESFFEEDFPE